MADAPIALAPSPSGKRRPDLPEAVQKHLGSMLQAAYQELPTSPTDRFLGLIHTLSAAIARQEHSDEQAFRADILQTMPSLQKFALSLTRNLSAADDLVQDTLLRGWRSRKRYQVGTNLGAWLFTIMRNHFYTNIRKTKNEVADVDGRFAEKVATLPEQMGRLNLQDFALALARLPDTMRQTLILVTIEHLSYEDAAAVMKCEIGTIKSRLSRGRQLLLRELGYGADGTGADSRTLSAMSAHG